MFNTDYSRLDLAIHRTATFSRCKRYRWRLTRTWDSGRPPLGWIMLNPSTADSTEDDPTIRRCMYFARQWNFGGIIVANLFALRSPDPTVLLKSPNPIGRHNNRAILSMFEECDSVIAAWGVHGRINGRADEVMNLVRAAGNEVRCLGMTKGGEPRHPLYVKKSQISFQNRHVQLNDQ